MGESLVGFVFGIAAAAAFGGATVLNRIGMRHRTHDNGVLMTVFVNVVVLGLVIVFAPIPSFDPRGILAFVAAGLLGTFLGRSSNLRAVRLIGPSRANVFMTTAPVVSAIGGWLILGEEVGVGAAVGAVIVLVGLRLVIRTPVDGTIAMPGSQEVPVPSLAESDHEAGERKLSGYLLATLGAVFFGLAFVMRKLGILWFPSAIVGAFLGAVSALVVITVIDSSKGRMPQRWRDNFKSVPWWFVAGGVTTSAALVLQFLAYFELPAWTVSLLQGTQVMWTLLWSYLWLRREEQLSFRLFRGVVLVVIGVYIVVLQV